LITESAKQADLSSCGAYRWGIDHGSFRNGGAAGSSRRLIQIHENMVFSESAECDLSHVATHARIGRAEAYPISCRPKPASRVRRLSTKIFFGWIGGTDPDNLKMRKARMHYQI